MAELVVILTPVIISMCQLMANDCSYSSIIQRPEVGRRQTNIAPNSNFLGTDSFLDSTQCTFIFFIGSFATDYNPKLLLANGSNLQSCCAILLTLPPLIFMVIILQPSPVATVATAKAKMVDTLGNTVFWHK